jgi:hypothetical protein
MKPAKWEEIFYIMFFLSTILWIIGIIIAVILDNHIIGSIGFAIFFTGVAISVFYRSLYIPFKSRKHPYTENLEEIKQLERSLEKNEIKLTIANLSHDRGRNAYEIAWMLEKNLHIELHIKKGSQAGKIKSSILYSKIDEILGVDTQDSWKPFLIEDFYQSTSTIIGEIIVIILCLLTSFVIILVSLADITI